MATERLQKILAKAGIASRRKAEELIQEGLVTINGRVAQLGDKAEMGKDAIKVKGKLLHTLEAPVYLAFHKPKGVISAMVDPEGRATLADFLKKVNARVYPIGRLDFNSEGLLLLTNDGEFAQEIQKRDNIVKVYHAKVKGHPTREMIARLEKGARLQHRHVKPHSIRVAEELASKSRVELVFLESGAIDVKTLLESKGFLTERIIRTAIGHLTLSGLLPGHFRYLKPTQAQALLEQPELGMRRLEHEIEKAGSPKREEEQEQERAPRPGRRDERPGKKFGAGARGARGRPREDFRPGKKITIRPRSEEFGAQGARGSSDDGYGLAREPRENKWGAGPERSERAQRGPRSDRGGFKRREGFKESSFGGESRGPKKPGAWKAKPRGEGRGPSSTGFGARKPRGPSERGPKPGFRRGR